VKITNANGTNSGGNMTKDIDQKAIMDTIANTECKQKDFTSSYLFAIFIVVVSLFIAYAAIRWGKW